MAQAKDGSTRAIEAPLSGTHIQIIACAGSGKTETLALRVAHLLAKQIPPESIVAFTFTEKAAQELKHRILLRSAAICGDAVLGRIGRMYVGTIHAFALQLLQTYAPRYAAFELIEEEALYPWIGRHCNAILGSWAWAGLWKRIRAFLKDADIIENQRVWPKGRDDLSVRYRNYVDTLEAHRLLTFGRSIAVAADELERTDVRSQVHRTIRYVFVDEYQDINPAQEALIRGLIGPDAQLCVVGDDDQSIYQWRGSDVALIQDFGKRYRPVFKAELDVNKRSVASIVRFAATFAKTIQPRLAKRIHEDRPQALEAHPVRSLVVATRADEGELIAQAIADLSNAGWHLGQMAILIRHWKQVTPILEALDARRLAYDCGAGDLLFATELGYLLAAGFTLWSGRTVPHGWKQAHLPQPPQTSADWVRQLARLLGLSKEQAREARAWIDAFALEASGKGTRPASLVGDLYELAESIGVDRWDIASDQQRLWFGAFARFSQVLASFEKARLSARWVDGEDGKEFHGGQDRGNWFYRALAFFLSNYALDATGGYVSPPDSMAPAVQITTVHGAKGLQWPIVFVPGLEEDNFPSKWAGQMSTDSKLPPGLISKDVLRRYAGSDADERRLFYVAVTRARDLLILSRAERANVNRVQASPYFTFAHANKESWTPAQGIGPIPPPLKVAAFTPPVPSLTFSDLAAYGTCPYSYRLGSEFDVAKPLARDLGYGKSIHHVLRRIADLVRESGKVPGAGELDRLFDAEFHVPYANAAGYARMKAAARKLVDRYITDWSADLHCVWEVERPFELHLDSVIIVGRADVILDREKAEEPKLIIVDYKSYDAKETDERAADQLRTYTAAARAEGYQVSGALIHNLANTVRHDVSVKASQVDATIDRAQRWAKGISNAVFTPAPEKAKCKGCDYRPVCRYAM